MAVSTRRRFEIFKRDGFACVYCGATPIKSPLHVDHVIAVANGGTDDPANLVTACRDCNLGKSAVPLEERTLAVGGLSSEEAREHAKQVKAYLKAQKELVAAKESTLNDIEQHWCNEFGTGDRVPRDLRGIARVALDTLDVVDICDAISAAARYVATAGMTTQVKYLCGILRTKRVRASCSPLLRGALERASRLGARRFTYEHGIDGAPNILRWFGTKDLPRDLLAELHRCGDEIAALGGT